MAMDLVTALAESVECPRCGARMWPETLLEKHLAIHEIRDLRYLADLKPLQHTFRNMRDWKPEMTFSLGRIAVE